MKIAIQFVVWLIIGLIALFLAILLGQQGSWYLAWVLGTAMIVLLAVAGTILLDAQDEGSAGGVRVEGKSRLH